MKTTALIGLLVCAGASAWADTHYAARNGQTETSPYTNGWGSAASNIQDAVNAATANDTVLVGAGRYTLPPNATNYIGTNVVFVNKSLILRSSNGAPESVVIDGEGAYRGLTIYAPFTLQGITFSNGYATNYGGGVLVVQNTGTGRVLNCVFASNTVAFGTACQGGGMWVGYTTPYAYVHIVSNCTFRDNRATYSSSEGGALFISTYLGWSLAVDTVFERNAAGNGGGIGLKYADAGVRVRGFEFERCVIRGNSAGNIYGGGGIHVGAPSVTILRNCLMYENRATNSTSSYGGAYTHQDNNFVTTQQFINCTIVSNSAGAYGGGGIFIRDWSGVPLPCPVVKMYNSIVYSNGADNLSMKAPAGSTNIILNSCSFPANATFQLGGTGNTTNNPRFVDFAVQNFRLSRTSPCINTGTNQSWMTGAVDLDGNPRLDGGIPLNGVDMGCYEYVFAKGTLILMR